MNATNFGKVHQTDEVPLAMRRFVCVYHEEGRRLGYSPDTFPYAYCHVVAYCCLAVDTSPDDTRALASLARMAGAHRQLTIIVTGTHVRALYAALAVYPPLRALSSLNAATKFDNAWVSGRRTQWEDKQKRSRAEPQCFRISIGHTLFALRIRDQMRGIYWKPRAPLFAFQFITVVYHVERT